MSTIRRRYRAWVVAILLAAALVATVVVTTGSDESTEQSRLVAMFEDAGSLEVGNEVRAAGVRVGSVESIELSDGIARVELDVDESILPVHEDATVNIRPINILGEGFVELDQGSDSAPYLESGVVDVSQTKNSVTLQDVLDTLDNPTATALAALVTTLGEGANQNGDDAAAAIKALAPTMQDVGGLGSVLSDQNEVLGQLVAQLDPIAESLASDDGRSMDRLVASAERMLTVLGANTSAIDQTLQQLPGALRDARHTLASLTRVSRSATPLLVSLRPITNDLEDVAGELTDFSTAADPALASVEPVLDRADALLDQAAPAVADLRAAGPDLTSVASDVRPVGDELLDQHLGDLMAFVRKWALSTNGRDGLSHYFRGVVHVTPDSLASLLGRPATPSPDGNTQGGQQDDGGRNPLDGLDGTIDDLLGGLDGLGGLLDGLGLRSGATGLTAAQEENMLSQLLGGL